jgi:hypothetical protein
MPAIKIAAKCGYFYAQHRHFVVLKLANNSFANKGCASLIAA